jgi:hypothetical protein
MRRAAKSDEYQTKYLAWPDTILSLCNLCKSPLKFAHAGSGKLVHELDGDIHQVLYYYNCSNDKCENYKKYFNPTPRYDYSKSYYGQDVINRIDREIQVFNQNPDQIYLRLTLDYELSISLRTVERMYNDCIMLKSNQIDEKTKQDMIDSKGIILAADAQDPGAGKTANWLFTDCIKGRLLDTRQIDSMPSSKLQLIIKEILTQYDTKLLGFVSDKQNNLVKCMKEYFPEIPHQYCTWHFVKHLWEHLEVFDNQIYSKLKSALNKLYIHSKNSLDTIRLNKTQVVNYREFFIDIDTDFQKMLNLRSKKFEKLKGLPLYRILKRYLIEMEENISIFSKESRFYKILSKVVLSLKTELKLLHSNFFEDLFMYDTFKVIYQLIYHPYLEKANRIQQIDDVFGKCWAVARIKNPELIIEDLRSFNPKTSSTCPTILGEWCRLWNSYLPGLFAYYQFSIDQRTNIAQEQAFSQELSKINRRMANSEVSYMQELQGDFYLRFSHCSNEELQREVVSEYMDEEIKTLRASYHQKVSKIAKKWFYKSEQLQGFKLTIKRYEELLNQKNQAKSGRHHKNISRKALKQKIKKKNETKSK